MVHIPVLTLVNGSESDKQENSNYHHPGQSHRKCSCDSKGHNSASLDCVTAKSLLTKKKKTVKTNGHFAECCGSLD